MIDLTRKKLFKGKNFDVSSYNFKISGRNIQHEIIEQKSASAVLAIENDNIIMVKQFRYPVKNSLEIPAGIKNKNETSLKCAKRELLEETGISKVSLIDGWSSRTEYSFSLKGVPTSKQVFWYLAETDELNVKLSHEHTNYMWVNFDEASEQLTFEQEVKILNSAKDFLNMT